MKWDVFVSYASEDKEFAHQLAHGLRSSGLQVWFDEFELEAGDGLRRTIDKGLRESRYGVVVLSQNFFRKEWPQRELDGFSVRDDGKQKVLIPVWYNVSVKEVADFSLPLADKKAVNYTGSVKDVVSQLLRAIERSKFADLKWKPHFITSSRGLALSVLPFQPWCGTVLCAGRFPVTNREYRSFVAESGHHEPSGERFLNGSWVGPFSPWGDPKFSSPEMPVVCVDFWDADTFCRSIGSGTEHFFLPPPELWDYLASDGQFGMSPYYSLARIDTAKIRDRSTAPFEIDRSGERDNALGISDLFGNVWEWCGKVRWRNLGFLAVHYPIDKNETSRQVELRGGGFLDDMSKVDPTIHSIQLRDSMRTRHADLGFRVCAVVETEILSPGLLAVLESFPSVPDWLPENVMRKLDYRRN